VVCGAGRVRAVVRGGRLSLREAVLGTRSRAQAYHIAAWVVYFCSARAHIGAQARLDLATGLLAHGTAWPRAPRVCCMPLPGCACARLPLLHSLLLRVVTQA